MMPTSLLLVVAGAFAAAADNDLPHVATIEMVNPKYFCKTRGELLHPKGETVLPTSNPILF